MVEAALPLLNVQGVARIFGGGRTWLGQTRPGVHALRGVTFDVRQGETLGIVGESGCGKSTLARILVGLDRPSAGEVHFQGSDLHAAARQDFARVAQQIQYIFQDPLSSLNPRKTVRAILETPLIRLLRLDRRARERRLQEVIEAVHLRPEHLQRYPHEFSGGQAQRIAIARAIAAEPRCLILDEPVSALDVSVQAQVLNLLQDLKERFALTYLFISHDLAVVEAISDRVAVMYFGKLAELGPREAIFAAPGHHYTRLLLESAPLAGRPLRSREAESGELPDPYDPPAGCAFAPRCPAADALCRRRQPPLAPAQQPLHLAACHHPPDVAAPPADV